ncbi:MAG TPA: TRAP transporter substrate-binding protein DctP [Actinomycetes bacterium]|jgi:TRAP-type C4-dicarboxylate transport system substrate-binding protein|nr:TRAP transporter substrate-binding protein DctP [Actinomycetes bacterium]
MHWMKGRAWLATVALAVIAAVVAGGCSGGGGRGDKAGGAGEPVVLRMANAYGDLNDVPAVQYFVSQVKERSGGNVRIQLVSPWGDYATDAEQQVVRAVATGKADLGWSGTRVFDTMGITSFQALQAPMLIDSYGLEHAVLASDIPGQMLQGLSKVGVRGLGVLADGLRRPIAVKHPMLGAADWRGITFGTLKSQGQAQAIRALGATPMEVFRRSRNQALMDGKLQGFEMSLLVYERNALAHPAPYVTANVTLWPQMDVLLANPGRLAALTQQQRGWLQQSARDAAGRSVALADRDVQSLKNSCQSGARFANASPADLASLRKAFAPVAASLEQDPQTKAFIQQIRALKRSTPAGAPLAIPAGCTGRAPEQPAGNTGTAPTDLNGTYRYVLTKEDAQKAGDTEDVYPQVTTVKLEDGQVEGGCFGQGVTYSVTGDRITFNAPEYGYSTTFTFSADDEGNLHLTPVPPMDRGDAFQCSYKAWTKIG